MSQIDPPPRTRPRYSDEQRDKIARVLDRKVDVRGEDECWPWMGSRLPKGYGSLKFWCDGRSQTTYAHRASFERANGFLPRVVRHSCDNPWCGNPKQLLSGNQNHNVRAGIERGRGRHARGSDHARAKLTDEQVVSIYHADGRHQDIARYYGVDTSIVTRIKGGRAWAHLTEGIPVRNVKRRDGAFNGRAKLTLEQVEEIRRAEGRQVDIAARYGVTQTTVSKIKLRKLW
jgi:hypothetical protein